MSSSSNLIQDQDQNSSRNFLHARPSGYMAIWNKWIEEPHSRPSKQKSQLFFCLPMCLQEVWISPKSDVSYSMILQARLLNMCIGMLDFSLYVYHMCNNLSQTARVLVCSRPFGLKGIIITCIVQYCMTLTFIMNPLYAPEFPHEIDKKTRFNYFRLEN